MKQTLLLFLSFSFYYTVSNAQNSPWEHVKGINAPIIAMGHFGGHPAVATDNGLFVSNDGGTVWTLKTPATFNYVWMLDSLTVGIRPRYMPTGGGYPALQYVLGRSIEGESFSADLWSFSPDGGMGSTSSILDFYPADDSTLCIAFRQTWIGGSNQQVNLLIGKNGGLNWSTHVYLGSLLIKRCFANGGNSLWMTTKEPSDSIFEYKADGSSLLFKTKVPSNGIPLVGGTWVSDTVFVVTQKGEWFGSSDHGTSWVNASLPFDTVTSFWRERGFLYIKNPQGLYRSKHFWDSAWDTIYQQGLSGAEAPEGIFRAGNNFLKKTSTCQEILIKHSGNTNATWEALHPIGLDPLVAPGYLLQNDEVIFQDGNCSYQENCGGIFRPTNLGELQPASFKHENGRFRLQAKDDTYLVLRTLNDGQQWDTLNVVNFFGTFLSAGPRLYLYSLSKVIYSDDLGINWIEANWFAANLLSDGIDTLVRQTSPSNAFVSFDQGNNWSEINNLPATGYLYLYKNRLAAMFDKKVWVSTDWGGQWALTLEIPTSENVNRTLIQNGIYLLEQYRIYYPVCQDVIYASTDGGLHWSNWSTPFYSTIPCAGQLLPGNLNAATGYLLQGDWLYAFTNYSGLWRARRDLLGAQSSAWPNDTICSNQTANFYGDPLSKTGFYEKIVSSSQGCDSLVHFNLVVTNHKVGYQNATACYGDTVVWNGQPYTSPGYYFKQLQAAGGCDSTAYLSLTFLGQQTVLPVHVFCQGDTFIYRGVKYWQSGTYLQRHPAPSGCDSITVIPLHVIPSDTLYFHDGICPGKNYYFANQILTQAGTYYYHNPISCVNVVMYLSQYDTASSDQDTTLHLGMGFLGQFPSTDTLITQKLHTIHGCDSTILWHVQVIVSGVSSLEANSWEILPNPARDQVVVRLNANAMPVRIRLADAMGRYTRDWSFAENNIFRLDVSALPAACYWLEIATPEGRSGKRLVLLK